MKEEAKTKALEEDANIAKKDELAETEESKEKIKKARKKKKSNDRFFSK